MYKRQVLCFGTQVLETYIASSDLFGYVDIFHSDQELSITSFQPIYTKTPGLNPENVVNGSAQHNDAVWFYGDNGLLIRCKAGVCEEAVKPTSVEPDFIDAWNTGEKLVFLTQDTAGYGLYTLTNGGLNTQVADWTVTAFDASAVDPGDTMTSITGNLDLGLVIGGYNPLSNSWLVWSHQVED